MNDMLQEILKRVANIERMLQGIKVQEAELPRPKDVAAEILDNFNKRSTEAPSVCTHDWQPIATKDEDGKTIHLVGRFCPKCGTSIWSHGDPEEEGK